MADFAPVKPTPKKPQLPASGDLYPPNNSRDFLSNMADAEFTSRYNKLMSKKRATNNRKPLTLLDGIKGQ